MENMIVQLPGLSLVRWTSSRLKEVLPKLQVLLKANKEPVQGDDKDRKDQIDELISKSIAIMLPSETESQEALLREAFELLTADNILVLVKALVHSATAVQAVEDTSSVEKSSKKRKKSQVDSDEYSLRECLLKKMTVVVKCMLVSSGDQLRASAVVVGSNFNEPALKELCLATCTILSHLIQQIYKQHDVTTLIPLVTNILIFFQSSLVFFSNARKVFSILTEHFLQPALQLLSISTAVDVSTVIKAVKSIFHEVYFIEKHVLELASVNYQQLTSAAPKIVQNKKKEDGKGSKASSASIVEKFFETVVQFFQKSPSYVSLEERGRGVSELWKIYAYCSKLSCLIEDSSDQPTDGGNEEDGKKKGASSSSRHSSVKDEVLTMRKHLMRILHMTFALVQYIEASHGDNTSQRSAAIVKSKACLFTALYDWMEVDHLSIPNHNSMEKYVTALRGAWKHSHEHVQELQQCIDLIEVNNQSGDILKMISFEYDSMRVLQLIDHRIAVDHLYEIGNTLCPSAVNADGKAVESLQKKSQSKDPRHQEFYTNYALFRLSLQNLFVDLWKLFVKLRSIDSLLNALLRASNSQQDCQSHWRKQMLYQIIQSDPTIKDLILSSFVAIPSGQWTKMWSILLHQASSSKKSIDKDAVTEEERSAKMLVESNVQQDVTTMDAQQKNNARASLCVLRSTFYAFAFSAQLHISKSTVIVHQSFASTRDAVVVDEHSQQLFAFLSHVVQSLNQSGDMLIAQEGSGESLSIFAAHASLLSAIVSYLVKSYNGAEAIRLLLTEVLVDEDEDTRRSCLDILSVDCMALMLDLVSSKHQKLLRAIPSSILSLFQMEMSFLHLMLNLRAKTPSQGSQSSGIQRCISELGTVFFSLLATVSLDQSVTISLEVFYLLLRQFNIWSVMLPHKNTADREDAKNLKVLQSFLKHSVSVYFDTVLRAGHADDVENMPLVLEGIATSLASISCADHAIMAKFIFEAVLSSLKALQTSAAVDQLRVSQWITSVVKVLPRNYFNAHHVDVEWLQMKETLTQQLIHFISSTNWDNVLDLAEESRNLLLEGISSSVTLLSWLLPAWLRDGHGANVKHVLAGDINVFLHHLLSFLVWKQGSAIRQSCNQVMAMYLFLRFQHALQHGVHAVDEFFDQLFALEDSLCANESRVVTNNETSFLQVLRTFHISTNGTSTTRDGILMSHLESIYNHRLQKLCNLYFNPDNKQVKRTEHSLLIGLLAEHFVQYRQISKDKHALMGLEKQVVAILVEGLTAEQFVPGTQLGWILLLNTLAKDIIHLLPASLMHGQREVYQALLRGIARLVLYFQPEKQFSSEELFVDCIANTTLAVMLSLFDVSLTADALMNQQRSHSIDLDEGLQLLNEHFFQWILQQSTQEKNYQKGVKVHFDAVLVMSKVLSHTLRKTTILFEECITRQIPMPDHNSKKIVKLEEGLIDMFYQVLTSFLPKLSAKDTSTLDMLAKVGAAFTNVEGEILQVLYASRNVSTSSNDKLYEDEDEMEFEEYNGAAVANTNSSALRDIGSKIVKSFNKQILTSSTMFVDVLLTSITHQKAGIASSQMHSYFTPLRQVLLLVNSIVTYAIRSHVPHITSNLAIFSELLEKLYKVLKLMQKHVVNAQQKDESYDTETMVRQGYQLLSRIFSNIANITDLEKHMHWLLASFINYLAKYIQSRMKSKKDAMQKLDEEKDAEANSAAMALEKEILFPGMFAIFEKLNLRQKTQMFKSMDAMSRAVMTDIHDDFMRTYKYQGN